MKKIFLACLIALSSLSLSGQQRVAEAAAQSRAAKPALPVDAPSRDQILTLLDLTQTRKALISAMGNMKQIMKESAEQSFRKSVPNPTATQLEALRGIYDDVTDMPLDEMMNAIISIYQRHLTKTDLEELIRFYSSPVGQKLLQEQPQIMRESMQAGAAIQQKRMDELTAKIKQRVEGLTGEDSSPAPKK